MLFCVSCCLTVDSSAQPDFQGVSADVAADVRRELVIVDAGVANHEQLVAGLLESRNPEDASLEVIVLDGSRDGVGQIKEALAGHTDIDAIHVIAHGSQAELRLGTARLTLDSMIGEYADVLAEIDQALTNDADILIYGCNFGRGALGRQAATRLAELTGADIAASDDLTGAQELGGDWDLEYATGSIEASVALGTRLQQDWSVLLASIIYYLDGLDDDSDIPTGALKAGAPTDTSFPVDNYDPGRNSQTGLTISKGGQNSGEGDVTKQQLWIASAGGVVLDSPATFTLWSAIQNFGADAAGEVTAFLVETDSDGSNLTELASDTITRADWDAADTATWIEDTFDFGDVSITIGAGRYLGVKIIVTDNSDTSMWFAYDNTSYDSRLDFSDPPVLVKRAFQPDGTPLPTGTNIPDFLEVKYLLYINNEKSLATNDVSIQDVLDSAFQYQTGTIQVDNSVGECALTVCTAAEELAIFTAVDGAAFLSDSVDGDVVSITGSTIDVGNQNAANAQLDISADTVLAVLFSVKMQ